MAVNVQVYDFYQWSIWWKRYQLELTLWPLLQIFERPKPCTDPSNLYMRPAEPWSFWAANSTAICKRICSFPLNGLHRWKIRPDPWRYLVWTVQRAYWKRREQEKQWGEGVRSESRRTLRILLVYQILVNPYEWFILTALVNSLLPYGNAKCQRWDHQLVSLLSKKYFVRWLSWPLCGLKCPLRTLIQLFILQQAISTARS